MDLDVLYVLIPWAVKVGHWDGDGVAALQTCLRNGMMMDDFCFDISHAAADVAIKIQYL